jgi:hypothetical protein
MELDLGALPVDPAGYPGFRFNVDTQLSCADVDPDSAELFVADMNELPMEDLIHATLPTDMKTLDRKLFKAVVKAVKPREHDEHLKDIQSKVKTGQGRHAVRVLDEAYEYEGINIAITAAGEIVNMEVKDLSQMGRYITGFRLHVQEMDNTGHSLPGLFVLEMVRKATMDLKDQRVQATIAEFEAKQKSEQTAKLLLDSLFRVYSSWKRRQGLKTKFASVLKSAAAKRKKEIATAAGAPGLVDAQGNSLCNYCGKGGHRWRDCRKRLSDEKSGVNKPVHALPKSKPKAYTVGKFDGKPPQKFDPCPVCKKTNHPLEKCFFRKRQEEQNKLTPQNALPASPSSNTPGVVPAGGAVVQGSGVGNLLEQVLAQKLLQKLNP